MVCGRYLGEKHARLCYHYRDAGAAHWGWGAYLGDADASEWDWLRSFRGERGVASSHTLGKSQDIIHDHLRTLRLSLLHLHVLVNFDISIRASSSPLPRVSESRDADGSLHPPIANDGYKSDSSVLTLFAARDRVSARDICVRRETRRKVLIPGPLGRTLNPMLSAEDGMRHRATR